MKGSIVAYLILHQENSTPPTDICSFLGPSLLYWTCLSASHFSSVVLPALLVTASLPV